MDLTRLECFVAVAEELHFGRAAERVHLTASPLSRAIRGLEHELGGDLFVRSYHHVELTVLGRELLPLARQVLQDAEALREHARRLTLTPSGPIRLGLSGLCPPLVGEAVERLIVKEIPGARVEVMVDSAAELLPRLERGQLSLALVQLPIGRPRLGTKLLMKLRVWVIMRNDDALADQDALRLDQLAGRTLVIGSPRVEPVAMDLMIARLRAHGVVDIVQLPEFDHVKMASRIRYNGALALTLHPRTGGSARIFDDEAFRLVPLTGSDFMFGLGAAWRRADAERPGPISRIVELLRTSWTPPALN